MSQIRNYVGIRMTELHDENTTVDVGMVVEATFRGVEVMCGMPLGAPNVRDMVEQSIKEYARAHWRRRGAQFTIDGRYPPPGTPNYLTIRQEDGSYGHVRWDKSKAEHWHAYDLVLREKKQEVDEAIDEFQHAKDVVMPKLESTGKTLGQLVIEFTFSDATA